MNMNLEDRESEGGTLAFVRVPTEALGSQVFLDNIDATVESVVNARTQDKTYKVVGLILGTQHSLLQVAPGNPLDLVWFVTTYLKENVEARIYAQSKKCIISTWDKVKGVIQLEFDLAECTDSTVQSINELLVKYRGSSGKNQQQS